jgi:uncharacterized alkaline shock family protein YloU
MATKTDKKANSNLPLTTDDLTPSSNITYNNEVVAIIAGLAANEVEGIAGMCTVSGSLMSKNRNVTKGVKVEVGTEEVAVDLYVIVEYGIPIQRAAADAQENVRKAIESMTGLHVVRVDVHVQSVSFEQEKKALQAGAQNAALEAGETAETAKLPEIRKEEPAKPEPKAAPAAKEAPKAEPAKAAEKPQPKAKAKNEPKDEPKKVKPVKAEKKAQEAPAKDKTDKDKADAES